MADNMKPVMVNGINIYPFKSSGELIDYVSLHPSILVALNAGKLGRSSTEMKQLINRNIGYCDGRAATLALQKKGLVRPAITGCDLWLSIVERFHKTKSFYLIGGTQDIIDNVVNKLSLDFPGIRILGHRNGFFNSDDEKQALIKDVSTLHPDIVFVAMGSPAQEELMSKLQQFLPGAIFQGLGGSFDVYSGKVARSPLWIRKMKMEGVYRAISRCNDKNIRKRFVLDLAFYLKLKFGIIK